MRWLVPEVVQTSEMDCGPAALAALCRGFDLPVDAGRLREACHTSVSGTSIDRIEDVAGMLGLAAEQRITPVDHLLHPASGCMPGLLVVQEPGGGLHFLILWRSHAIPGWPLLQIMDPAHGRRWISPAALSERIYQHTASLPLSLWRQWAQSDSVRIILSGQIRALSGDPAWIDEALAAPGWRSFAALDAAVRLCSSLLAGGMPPAEAGPLLEALWREAALTGPGPDAAVPGTWWCTFPDGDSPDGDSPDGDSPDDRVLFRGAVVLAVSGVRATAPEALPEGLRLALASPEVQPVRALWGLLPARHRRGAALLAGLIAAGVIAERAELLLFQGGLSLEGQASPASAAGALAVLVMAGLILLLLEVAAASGSRWLGRSLEQRFWLSFFERVPRLGDRYFHSRLITDMADRSRSIPGIRLIPEVARGWLSAGLRLLTASGLLLWLDPALAPALPPILLICLLLPLLLLPALRERDLRSRTHSAGISRSLLGALLGAAPVRTHNAAPAIRAQQEQRLTAWVEAGRSLLGAAVVAELIQGGVAAGAAILLVGLHLRQPEGASGWSLLLLYAALQLPAAATDLSRALTGAPAIYNPLIRLLEPLLAPVLAAPACGPMRSGAAAIRMEGLSVVASGQPLLSNVHLDIRPGEHIAVVGASGAGKSTLLGVLLGWHTPAAGRLEIDGAPLDGPGLAALRRQTAWVDPAVHLRDASLAANLAWGGSLADLPGVLDAADLRAMLEQMPRGLRTAAGEGGALLSGGEGQRLRLGRAMLRDQIRLVLLDEPFRGLDQGRRAALLDRARARWRDQTLLFVTHDIATTRRFPRVLVIEDGRVVEDGRPGDLLLRASRYRLLIDAGARVQRELWEADLWKRVTIRDGRIGEP